MLENLVFRLHVRRWLSDDVELADSAPAIFCKTGFLNANTRALQKPGLSLVDRRGLTGQPLSHYHDALTIEKPGFETLVI